MNGPPPVECSYTSPPSTDNLFHNFIYEAIEQEGGRVQPCVSNADEIMKEWVNQSMLVCQCS